MSRVAVSGCFGLLLCGCVSSTGSVGGRQAIVDDVTGKAPYLSGYCVDAVDGKPVRRATSSTVTVIPMALVDPGRHALTIGERTVTAVFEAGKSYRIKNEHGTLSVVEKVD